MNTTDIDSVVSCTTCDACCCRLEVLLMSDDDIPTDMTVEDPRGGSSMRRLRDGWCVALDRNTMKCTIYQRRPVICREYRMGGDECIEDRAAWARIREIIPQQH